MQIASSAAGHRSSIHLPASQWNRGSSVLANTGVIQCKWMEGSTPRGAAAAIAILCSAVGAY
jgi:hypothetical protein